MSPNRPRQTPRRIAFTVFALVYILGGALLLAYGSFTDTGLSGWLMNQQMRYFGGADSRVTLIGNALVWIVSIVPVFYGLIRLNQAEGFTPTFPGQQPPVGGQSALSYQQQQARMYSPRNRAVLAALFLALGGGAYLYFRLADAHLAAQPVVPLDLNRGDQLPSGTELASVRGLLAANFGFALEETKYGRATGTTIYAPLLPESWEPGQPVKFVVKTKIPVYQDLALRRVFYLDSGQVFPAIYDGRLSTNDLPTYVSQHLASQRLTLANPHYIIDDQEVAMGHATLPNESRRWVALGLGVLVAVVVLVQKQPKA